jgi:hypothetical protein
MFHLRLYEILTVMKMSILVFWVVTPRELAGGKHVSEEHTASILGAGTSALQMLAFPQGERPQVK